MMSNNLRSVESLILKTGIDPVCGGGGGGSGGGVDGTVGNIGFVVVVVDDHSIRKEASRRASGRPGGREGRKRDGNPVRTKVIVRNHGK
jgi:hypothetical protein